MRFLTFITASIVKMAATITMIGGLLGAMPLQAAEGDWLETDFVKIRLISASETAGTTGTLALGLEMRLAEGWKTYWRTPGDAGLAPQLFADRFMLAGADVDLQFPLPKRFTLFGLDTFGYGERVIFPVRVQLADIAHASTIDMSVDALVCSDICVPVQGELRLSLPQGPQTPSIYHQELAKIRSLLPKIRTDLNEALSLSLAGEALDPEGAGHLLLTSTLPMTLNDVLIENVAGASFAAPQKLAEGRYLIAHNGGSGRASVGDALMLTIDGAIGQDGAPFEMQAVIQPASVGKNSQSQALPLWLIALLGGFLLNFMPCVLPVLSLKLSSVLHMAERGQEEVRARFLASAAGIMSSFILLAVFLQIVRRATGFVGWGIQFQSPVFLAILLVVSFLFTLSLFNLFHFRVPQFVNALVSRPVMGDGSGDGAGNRSGKSGYLASDFGAGMLATLLATPCSAPFVGTAVSFALTSSDSALYGIMVMMGLGLALPWLLFAAFPKMIGFLPRPGQWMVYLQRGLGVLMALTVLWIGSLFINAAGLRADRQVVAEAGWVAFDEGKLAALRASGAVILVDVTANWCITCKANKALVLDTAPVRALLAENDVVLMQADWTHPDEAIARYLASYERFGIPFDILYGKGANQGIILPEILTTSALEKALLTANQ